MPVAFLELVLRGRNGINGAASIQLSRNYGVIPGPVVDIYHAGHNPLRDISSGEDAAPIVKYLDDIAVF